MIEATMTLIDRSTTFGNMYRYIYDSSSISEEDLMNLPHRDILKFLIYDPDRPNLLDIDSETHFAQYWYKDGELHRDGGPAAIERNGSEFWYQNGRFHRDIEPAIIYSNGHKYWYIQGLLHRLDGPAIENPEDPLKEWYIWDNEVSEEEYWEYMNLKKENPVAHKLKYSNIYDLTYEKY